MSVINQMLRDLDARGQGDAGARRRAAMVSVGDAGGKAPSAWLRATSTPTPTSMAYNRYTSSRIVDYIALAIMSIAIISR